MIFCQECGGRTTVLERGGQPRPVCDKCGAATYLDPKLAAAVIIERGGRLLLGLRGPDSNGAGRWSFPAGFVERGERIEDAAIRESREEVGLAIVLGPLLGLFSERGETVALAVYLADAPVGDPVAGDDLIGVDWFSPGELPELAFPRDRDIIDVWRAKVVGR